MTRAHGACGRTAAERSRKTFELAACIADRQDYYADEGVHVSLRDGCTWDEERLRHCAIIGPGRAPLSRLTDGATWAALNVHTHRPLF